MYRPGRHQARERRQHTFVELIQSQGRFLRRARIVDGAEENRVCRRFSWLVSAPSGPFATIILQDGSLDRLGNLYRGRGGPPIRKVLR